MSVERPNSKGSRRRFDLGLGQLDKSRRGARTNINEEDSEYSVTLNQLHDKYDNPDAQPPFPKLDTSQA